MHLVDNKTFISCNYMKQKVGYHGGIDFVVENLGGGIEKIYEYDFNVNCFQNQEQFMLLYNKLLFIIV